MGATQTLHNGAKVTFESAQDKAGNQIAAGDEVNVGDPRAGDMHRNAFRGTVVDIYGDGIVCVVDQDSDCFDVDADNVELVEG